ncbi:CinA family protein [Coprothermobacteraceae bacterium]|nr:CinA family protein [Coprothermobacteraceae bacterium]
MAIKKAKRIQQSGKRIALAESCTGGQVVSWLSMLPGSSKFLWGGVTVYTQASKRALLGVISNEPASPETAEALAKSLPETDVRVAVVGNLGPSTELGAPRGCVYAYVVLSHEEVLKSRMFKKGRLRNRFLSSYWVLFCVERVVR